MSGIYIHIPFCRRKCLYCDFYSIGARNAPWNTLVDSLLAEAYSRAVELARPPRTLYIGGGTPSLMPADQFRRLVSGLRAIFDCTRLEEFTVEVNPEDVDTGLVDRMAEAGVSRASMGIQSFSDSELRAIGRRHTAARAIEAYGLLRKLGNVSIDLIFGLPDQDIDRWQDNVAEALRLHPEHISAYSLMWEPGTPLELLRRQGRRSEVPEELSAEMFATLSVMLRAAGYEQYEISNYALPGYRSRHNSSYWQGLPYLGLGPGAHSYDGVRTRRANPADILRYTRHFTAISANPYYEEEVLTDDELREEYLLTRLRTREGFPISEFLARFGRQPLQNLLTAAQPHADAGHLRLDSDRIALTKDGIMVSDTIISDLF